MYVYMDRNMFEKFFYHFVFLPYRLIFQKMAETDIFSEIHRSFLFLQLCDMCNVYFYAHINIYIYKLLQRIIILENYFVRHLRLYNI